MKLHNRICCVSSLVFYFLGWQYVQAGPVIRPSRMVREIYPEVEQEIPDSGPSLACTVGDTTYPSDSPVPSTQPCLKCLCLSGQVVCEAESCGRAPGCRAVHAPGRCCPAYHCECALHGRVYANGERLPQAPGAECSVCYCRGGHVQCAEVGCYTRTDCEPRYVKGECCPKYDHCPPRDPLSDRISGTSPTLQNLEPDFLWSQTRPENTSAASSEEGSGDDDIAMSDEPRIRVSTPVTFSIKEIESKTNSKRNDDKVKVIMVDKTTQTDSEGRPKITIQEVIPPRTEFVPRRGPGGSTSPLPLLTDSSNELTDVESYASEKTEVYDHPPPVLRIGDQLLFIKQGQLVPEKDASTPSPVITLIGAEGLQIGLGSGEDILQATSEASSSQTVEIDSEESSTTTKVKTVSSEESTEINDTLEQNEFITINSSSETSTESQKPSVEPEHSEYIPEENPYYPPIPEDIMIQGQDEITTDVTSESTVKSSTKPNDSTNSDEITVIPLSAKKMDDIKPRTKTTDPKILPDVLELRINTSITTNQTVPSQEWLKNEEPTKITIPLINEQAALPDSILELTAPSDLNTYDDTTNTIFPSTAVEEISSTESTNKSDKIVSNPDQNSKETLEINEELFESGEFTTISPVHSSLMSNEDASVELIQNDSTPVDMSDLVEMVPGFEKVTEKVVENEEHLKTSDGISPKDDVEMINVSVESEEKSHVEMKDFHDEIQKRDVVKKVLKDTFENPKENIRTDLIEDSTDIALEISGQNEEQNIVKPNHDLLTRSLNVTNTRIEKIPANSSADASEKELQVIQKVNTDNTKLNVQESKETLDTSSLGVLRDFFNTQFRQYHNPKLAD